MYPGAMFLLVPRILFGLVSLLLLVIFMNLLMIGHDRTKPLARPRKLLLRVVSYIFLRLIAVGGLFTWHTYRYISPEEVDYSEYLGTSEVHPVCQSIGK